MQVEEYKIDILLFQKAAVLNRVYCIQAWPIKETNFKDQQVT